MKRSLRSTTITTSESDRAALWRMILSRCQTTNVFVKMSQVNKWFYSVVDLLRDEVIIARLNVKYSKKNDWFICDDCGNLYLSDKDQSHVELDSGDAAGDYLCWHCIASCEWCDQCYLVKNKEDHAQCGKDPYEDDLLQWSMSQHK